MIKVLYLKPIELYPTERNIAEDYVKDYYSLYVIALWKRIRQLTCKN